MINSSAKNNDKPTDSNLSTSLFIEPYDDKSFQDSELKVTSKFRMGFFKDLNKATTIANLIRRSLISDIPTTGIVGVKIPKIVHEFSSIPGVKEDVIELILNLRSLVFKGYLQESMVAQVKFIGPGIITTENIFGVTNIISANSPQYIATVEDKITFEMSLIFATGIGTFTSGVPSTYLPVISVFAPVISVVYHFESFDTLDNILNWHTIFEIQTDGSIPPSQALITAIRVVQEIFKKLPTTMSNIVSQPKENRNTVESTVVDEPSCENMSVSYENVEPNITHLESLSIDILKLPSRTYKCLRSKDIVFISDLIDYSKADLLNLKGIGRKSIQEISESLFQVCGLTLS